MQYSPCSMPANNLRFTSLLLRVTRSIYLDARSCEQDLSSSYVPYCFRIPVGASVGESSVKIARLSKACRSTLIPHTLLQHLASPQVIQSPLNPLIYLQFFVDTIATSSGWWKATLIRRKRSVTSVPNRSGLGALRPRDHLKRD